MKLNRLETHDRLEYFKKDQAQTIFQGCDDCLKKNPDSLMLQDRSPYIYIFAHPRTHDDGVTKRMLWQPRLKKPKAEPNSYLFKARSKTDIVEVCWLIPPKELWRQFRKGNLTEEPTIVWSIDQFCYQRKKLEAPDAEDFSDEKIWAIWEEIKQIKRSQKESKIVHLTTGPFDEFNQSHCINL